MKKTLVKKTIPPLKRVIGLAGSMMLVTGIMIGTGIFKKITPMAASGLSESSILMAWIAAGIITMLGALSASALAELTSESGGEYEYIRLAFGSFPAFIFGWSCFTVIGSASVAAMSHLFVSSFIALFPHPLFSTTTSLHVLACAIILLLTLLNIMGTRLSMNVNNGLTYMKLAGLLLLIVGAFLYKRSGQPVASFHSIAITENRGMFSVFFAAMLSAFWAYDGWLSVAFMSGEIKNPQRNLPKAIVGGIFMVMVIYVLVNWAFMNVMPLQQLAAFNDDQIAAAGISEKLFGEKGNAGIALLILVSTLGSLNGIIATYSRMYYKMATDGYFFKTATLVSEKYQTPHGALLLAMLVSWLLVFSGGFEPLTNMIVFAGFVFYSLMAWGVILLRRKGRIRAVNIGYPIVPVLFIVCSIILMLNTLLTDPVNAGWGLVLMATGIPLYFYFKRKGRTE